MDMNIRWIADWPIWPVACCEADKEDSFYIRNSWSSDHGVKYKLRAQFAVRKKFFIELLRIAK
jgi:hypothetical protein